MYRDEKTYPVTDCNAMLSLGIPICHSEESGSVDSEIWSEPKVLYQSFIDKLPSDMQMERQQWEESRAPADKPLRQCFEDDFEEFSNYFSSFPSNDKLSNARYMHVASETEIPQSLLSGPWTEDMIRHLFWLVKAGAQINSTSSITGEVC